MFQSILLIKYVYEDEMIKKIFLGLLITLYVIAGINHFWHPAFYIRLIPPYLPNPVVINIVAGCAEIVLGTMLMFARYRKWAALGIIVMLVAFIPSHVYSLQIAGCSGDAVCPRFVIAWVRFFIVHPFLIAWAWWCRN